MIFLHIVFYFMCGHYLRALWYCSQLLKACPFGAVRGVSHILAFVSRRQEF
jgi:hypothetical protein